MFEKKKQKNHFTFDRTVVKLFAYSVENSTYIKQRNKAKFPPISFYYVVTDVSFPRCDCIEIPNFTKLQLSKL